MSAKFVGERTADVKKNLNYFSSPRKLTKQKTNPKAAFRQHINEISRLGRRARWAFPIARREPRRI